MTGAIGPLEAALASLEGSFTKTTLPTRIANAIRDALTPPTPSAPGWVGPSGNANRRGENDAEVMSAGTLGIVNRAMAKGLEPTKSGILATMRRNAAVQATIDRGREVTRAREAANAVAQGISNTNRIVGAILGISIPSYGPVGPSGNRNRQGENDVDPAPILPGGDARGKMTPSPGSGDFRLTVKATPTARDMTVVQQKRTAYSGATVKAIGLA